MNKPEDSTYPAAPNGTGRRAVFTRRVALVLALLFVGFEFVRRYFGTLSVVEGVSMYPTLRPNDVVHARTALDEVTRGSVVILTDNRGEQAVKRVIGLPGERVSLHRGFVYINQHRLREPYLLKHTYTFKRDSASEHVITWRLGPEEFFVLGDNRLESYDSRHFGPVASRQLIRVVSLPDNAAQPSLGEIILSEAGTVVVRGNVPSTSVRSTVGEPSDHGPAAGGDGFGEQPQHVRTRE